MHFQAKIYVTLKDSVLDPQGKTVAHALHALHYENVTDVRIGKYMEVRLVADSATHAKELVGGMCNELLTNPVIEKYSFDLVEVDS